MVSCWKEERRSSKVPAPVSNLINRPHPQPETQEQGYIYETSLAVPWAQPTSSLLSVLLGICLNLPFHHHGSLPAAPFVSFLGSSHPQALAFLSQAPPLGRLVICSLAQLGQVSCCLRGSQSSAASSALVWSDRDPARLASQALMGVTPT